VFGIFAAGLQMQFRQCSALREQKILKKIIGICNKNFSDAFAEHFVGLEDATDPRSYIPHVKFS